MSGVSRTLENQERRKGMIKRDYYLEKIKDKMWNGSVKIITGIRRCEKVYMQSAFSISDPEYKVREVLPMNKTGDNFRKIVVTSGASRLWTDENGISYGGILTFLLNPERVLP